MKNALTIAATALLAGCIVAGDYIPRPTPDRADQAEPANGFPPACTPDGRRCHGGGKPDPTPGSNAGSRQ